jgi:hypothetical protein
MSKCPENHKRYGSKKHARNDLYKLALKSANDGNPTWENLNLFRHAQHWHIGRHHLPQKFPKDMREYLNAVCQAAMWSREAEAFAKRMVDEIFAGKRAA